MTAVLRFHGEPARVLDFDTENRPLSYLGQDWTTGEVTAIAARYIGEPEEATHVFVLGAQCGHGTCRRYHHGDDPRYMLESFHALYDAADMVTGHFIRAFDLPVLNGMMLEYNLPPLADKLAHDTKLDLRKRSKISVSQENLGEMLGLESPKVGMSTPKWRLANRLTPEGIALTRRRVVGDVRQHIEMRARLIELGWLAPPRVWKSSGQLDGAYVP